MQQGGTIKLAQLRTLPYCFGVRRLAALDGRATIHRIFGSHLILPALTAANQTARSHAYLDSAARLTMGKVVCDLLYGTVLLLQTPVHAVGCPDSTGWTNRVLLV